MVRRVSRMVSAGIVAAALVVGGLVAPAHAAPVPGRFCKSVDVGKFVGTVEYGTVKCVKEGSRARWKRVR